LGTTASAYQQASVFDVIFKHGHLGVDFFFVLSGFIIFNAHFKDIGKRDKVILYAKKRFFRIYPIFFIVISSKILIFFLLGMEFREEQKSLNYLMKSYLLFPIEGQFPLVSVSWTLCHELTFYLIFLISIMKGKKVFFSCTIFWAISIICYNCIEHEYNFTLAHFLSPYNFEFIIGIFTGWTYHNKKRRSKYLLFCFAAILLFCSITLIDELALRLVLGSSFGFIILACTDLPKFKSKILRTVDGTLFLIGNASYSIYLIHTLIISALYQIFLDSINLNALGFISFFVSLITGILIWRLVEFPLLQFTRKRFINKVTHT
jgi:peptidoglycan/LPS O-acetylase OafA/YrhL